MDFWATPLPALDEAAGEALRERLAGLTKPLGSLGRLEELAVHLGRITGETHPQVARRAVVVMAGDHGVTAEGVSTFPAEVTAQMVRNFLRGGAGINVLARQAGARVLVVDVGVSADLNLPGLRSAKVRPGTANLAEGPAMSETEARAALTIGYDIAGELTNDGVEIIGTGEMGIGNTTPASALLAVFGHLEATEVVGMGTGLDSAGVEHKTAVLRRALQTNRPDPARPLEALARVGGLEIAALAGLILGCAYRRRPVVLDGFISGAAALVAEALAPGATAFMIPSHLSAEPGHRRLLDLLGLRAMLHLDLRLGEGTGAALAFPILEAATRIPWEMATFSEAAVSPAPENLV